MGNTIQTVNDLIRENSDTDLHEIEINPDDNLQNDLGMDSMDVTSLVMDIERKFDVMIDDTEFEAVYTVQDLYNLVESKLK